MYLFREVGCALEMAMRLYKISFGTIAYKKKSINQNRSENLSHVIEIHHLLFAYHSCGNISWFNRSRDQKNQAAFILSQKKPFSFLHILINVLENFNICLIVSLSSCSFSYRVHFVPS